MTARSGGRSITRRGMAECWGCGRAVVPDARFCPACGTPLNAVPERREHIARKTVTVLFSDVAGFTPLTERTDPSDCGAS